MSIISTLAERRLRLLKQEVTIGLVGSHAAITGTVVELYADHLELRGKSTSRVVETDYIIPFQAIVWIRFPSWDQG